ncbi:MAG: exopolyphosphatase, partial [Terriglobales bacterium]
DGPVKVLPNLDRESIPKASVLLRLARALNLSRSHALSNVRVRVQDAKVQLVLITRPRSTLDLELWAVEKERNYFREVFGRELSVAAA